MFDPLQDLSAEERRVLCDMVFGTYSGALTTAAMVGLAKHGFVTYRDGKPEVTGLGRWSVTAKWDDV